MIGHMISKTGSVGPGISQLVSITKRILQTGRIEVKNEASLWETKIISYKNFTVNKVCSGGTRMLQRIPDLNMNHRFTV